MYRRKHLRVLNFKTHLNIIVIFITDTPLLVIYYVK